MKNGFIKRIAMELLSNKKGTSVGSSSQYDFIQSGTFRGFKRYRLTIYQEPGVAEGIEHFRDTKNADKFVIPKEANIRLLLKQENSYKVLEIYVDNYKVGVMYESNGQFENLFAKPFDKAHVRIDYPEVIIHKNGIEHRPIVYLFVHYIEN